MQKVTLAIDIMGGDKGPHVFFGAIKRALKEHPKLHVTICATEAAATAALNSIPNACQSRVSTKISSQVVDMNMRPAQALRKMTDASMRVALQLVYEGDANGCVSCGNTGALMAMAYHLLKTIPGISRPALVSSLPTVSNDKVLLLDLGASINCDAENLLQYAVMGSVFKQCCENIQNPRVALLNVGEEEIKGNSVIKHADALLRLSDSLNYIGYVEGDDIFAGKADVVVTDGFTGNIALKASEGIAKLLIYELKTVTKENFLMRNVGRLMLPFLKKLYQRMNPDQYNGASLIGLRGTVVKSHGNATTEACYYAIKQAISEIELSVPDRIKSKIEHEELLEH